MAANALLAQLAATASIVAAKGNTAEAERISGAIRDLREVLGGFASAVERLVLVLDGKEKRSISLQADGAAAYTHDQVKQTMAAADAARAEKKYREEAEKYRKNAEAARKNAEAQLQARYSKAVQVATEQLQIAIEHRNAAQREVDTARMTRDILNARLKDVERAEGRDGDA